MIYFSRFYLNTSGHGGDKRTAQICEILQPMGCQLVSMCNYPQPFPENLDRMLHKPANFVMEKYSIFLKQRLTDWKYFNWNECIRNHVIYMSVMTRLFCESLQVSKPGMLLIDDPVFLAPAVHYAKTHGVPLVAFCHNLETLSREQVTASSQRDMFKYELELLAGCDLIVTISREETFLLKNFGMKPLYFPYFPATDTLNRMAKVRLDREKEKKKDFLLLGTVHNLPTLEGMKQVISRVRSDSPLSGTDRLLIAGYGTGKLQDLADGERVVLLGEVSDTELDNLLTAVKCCIVYQENGSGALTKIPELLAAGVPLVINSHAARSYYNLPGIIEFESLEQLPDKMTSAAGMAQFTTVLYPPDLALFREKISGLLGCI